VVGEIRERHLEALPPAHLYVGRTQLSLDAIRCYNAAQRLQYELHDNDCRWVAGVPGDAGVAYRGCLLSSGAVRITFLLFMGT
jgi:hypothetical protein